MNPIQWSQASGGGGGSAGMTTTVPGFTVRTTDSQRIPYHLVNNRADYSLIRKVGEPHIMFAVDQKGKPVYVRGSRIFTDKNGRIEAARADDGAIDKAAR